MGAPGKPPLKPIAPPALPTPVARLADRLRRRLRGERSRPAGGEGPRPPADPLLQAGRRLREAREAQGLGLRQLAQETRISTPVLEALEKGWRERLPEAAYLRTMVPLLEQRLQLPPGSLEPALPSERLRPHGPRREPLLRRFTPGSIDVFTTWQGTLLYGLLTLGLIYGVNLQQQQLAARGLLAVRPIPPLPAREQAKPPRPERVLLTLYPDLRPLELAAHGQGLDQLRRSPTVQPLRSGVLELQLGQPSQLSLDSASGVRTSLRSASGSLSLPLTGGFQLEIEPPPRPGDGVNWNGTALQPIQGKPGRFSQP